MVVVVEDDEVGVGDFFRPRRVGFEGCCVSLVVALGGVVLCNF